MAADLPEQGKPELPPQGSSIEGAFGPDVVPPETLATSKFQKEYLHEAAAGLGLAALTAGALVAPEAIAGGAIRMLRLFKGDQLADNLIQGTAESAEVLPKPLLSTAAPPAQGITKFITNFRPGTPIQLEISATREEIAETLGGKDPLAQNAVRALQQHLQEKGDVDIAYGATRAIGDLSRLGISGSKLGNLFQKCGQDVDVLLSTVQKLAKSYPDLKMDFLDAAE